jgi:sulfate permease, SulP family
MAFLEHSLRSVLVDQPECHDIILDFAGVNDMDAVAVETLEALIGEMESQGVTVRIAAMKGPVRDITARAGWPERFGDRIAYGSIERALEDMGMVAAGQGLSALREEVAR